MAKSMIFTDSSRAEIEFKMVEERRGRILSPIPTSFYQGNPQGVMATIETDDGKQVDVFLLSSTGFTLMR